MIKSIIFFPLVFWRSYDKLNVKEGNIFLVVSNYKRLCCTLNVLGKKTEKKIWKFFCYHCYQVPTHIGNGSKAKERLRIHMLATTIFYFQSGCFLLLPTNNFQLLPLLATNDQSILVMVAKQWFRIHVFVTTIFY